MAHATDDKDEAKESDYDCSLYEAADVRQTGSDRVHVVPAAAQIAESLLVDPWRGRVVSVFRNSPSLARMTAKSAWRRGAA